MRAEKAEGKMIDWDRVAALRDELGAADFAEVVEMFLSESDDVIARLRAGRPYPTLEAELHFLKGSALNLGFHQLAALCGQGEKRAASGQVVDLKIVVESYTATRSAFAKGLRDRRAA
jgi:HPt (histidine-containing phosphotransfer) domain-containing protein